MAGNGILYCWNSGGNLLNGGTPTFLRNGSFTSAVENTTTIVVPSAGFLTNLIVKLASSKNTDSSPGLGNSRKFTVRINGVNTALSVIIDGKNTTGSSSAKVKINEYDLISLVHVSSPNITNNAIGVISLMSSLN